MKVLFIGGSGRSGSTLLDRLLGELPGFVSVGELRYIWREGVQENRRCGCGAPFLECRFWSDVGRKAFGGWKAIDIDEVVDLERTLSRQRHLPGLRWPKLRPAAEPKLRRYRMVLRSLYQAIGDVSGARVVVDSSKDPAYGFLLARAFGPDLRVVHLVRDSRGVAFSWSKLVRSPESAGGEVVEMRRFSPLHVGARWDAYNVLLELLGASAGSRLLVRYEDLVSRPTAELGRVAGLVDETPSPQDLAFLGDGWAQLEPHHTAAGNPMRLQAGRIALRLDDEWRSALDRRKRAQVTGVTWPLLRRYGYLGDVARSRLAAQ